MFKYRLKTLFIAITLLCVFLAAFIHPIAQRAAVYRSEQKLLSYILTYNPKVSYTSQGEKSWLYGNMWNATVCGMEMSGDIKSKVVCTDQHYNTVSKFTNLSTLSYKNYDFTKMSSSMVYDKVTSIYFQDCKLSVANLQHLLQRSSLDCMYLLNCSIDCQHLSVIDMSRLDRLVLSGPGIPDDFIAAIKRPSHFRELDLSYLWNVSPDKLSAFVSNVSIDRLTLTYQERYCTAELSAAIIKNRNIKVLDIDDRDNRFAWDIIIKRADTIEVQ
jgi:hypothetical protein